MDQMDIHEYAAALIQQVEASRPSADISNEAAFEQEHVVVPAWELSRVSPSIRVFTHPANRRPTCTPDCESAASEFANRVEGCPLCWAASKPLSIVDAFGTRNNFDLVAIDQAGGRLAVEVKWLSARARPPTASFSALSVSVPWPRQPTMSLSEFAGSETKREGPLTPATTRSKRSSSRSAFT
jgi:hypothetical protein